MTPAAASRPETRGTATAKFASSTVLSRETHSFDAIYREHFGFVWRSVRGLGVPVSAVDDAVQDVFLVVHRKLASYQPDGSIVSWLFGIARRVAKDQRRSLARRGVQVELESADATSNAQDPQDTAATRETLSRVAAFLDGLDEERRSLFVLAQLEGLPLVRVGEMLNLNPNTAYSRLRVLREELSATLREAAAGTATT